MAPRRRYNILNQTRAIYPNPGRSATPINGGRQKCLFCKSCRIPPDRRLCDQCLRRGHIDGCPSPCEDCSCGFSSIFWLNVASQVSGPVVREADGAIGNLTIHSMGHRPGKRPRFSAHAGCKEFPQGCGEGIPTRQSAAPKTSAPEGGFFALGAGRV